MKATGIVRRIDDLGRVVIPKEIRRTQLIRVGDPLEIFVNAEGEVIFKKYSPIGEIAPFAVKYAEVLYKTAGVSVLVADRDHIVAAAGTAKSFVDRRVSTAYEKLVDTRRVFCAISPQEYIYACEGAEQPAIAVAPILCQGDLIGSVALLGTRDGAVASEAEMKMLLVAASFLGRQMEE